jgi:hypothetical protein
MTTYQSGQGAISNILAIAGFIILIAIIVWGAFHFLGIASSGFSSLFGGGGNEINVSLSSEEVTSGEPVDVSWGYETEVAGTYSLLYQCRDGFIFRVINANGVVNTLPCGTAVPLGNESVKTARLVPALSGTDAVDVTLTLVFAPTEEAATTTPSERAEGTAEVTVNPQATPSTTPPTPTPAPAPAPSPVSTPTPVAPTTPVGKPDLVVRVLAVGVIDSYSGSFVSRMPTSQYDIVAVKFDVANQGSAPSGSYYFNAQLPTAPASPYVSPLQASLAPGSHIENTLRFNNVTSGGALFSVTVDPSGAVNETNESNNYASQWVSGGYTYPTTYPYSY